MESAKDVEWGVRAVLANTMTEEQRHVQFKCDAALPKELQGLGMQVRNNIYSIMSAGTEGDL